MTNLTISVDDEILKRARIRALEEDTSVNAVLAHYLTVYAQADALQQQRQAALDALLSLAEHFDILAALKDGDSYGAQARH